MNPQQTSGLIATLVALCLGPGSYLVSRGILSADQATQLQPAIVTVVTLVGGALIAWWQHRANSNSNLVSTVNSPSIPNVKVVSSASPATEVSVTPTGAVVTAPPPPKEST